MCVGKRSFQQESSHTSATSLSLSPSRIAATQIKETINKNMKVFGMKSVVDSALKISDPSDDCAKYGGDFLSFSGNS